jgi:hypothetical protein
LKNKRLAMITKTQLKNAIESLPENMTIDQVIDHLLFIEKVQKGIGDSNNEKVYTTEQAKEKLKKWLK